MRYVDINNKVVNREAEKLSSVLVMCLFFNLRKYFRASNQEGGLLLTKEIITRTHNGITGLLSSVPEKVAEISLGISFRRFQV